MSRFPDGARVRLCLCGTPYPGVRFGSDLPRLPRNEWVEMSAAEANDIFDRIPDRSITEDDMAVEVDEVVDATGAAETLADEAGVDLAAIDGTGKNGRVLKSDVQSAIDE